MSMFPPPFALPPAAVQAAALTAEQMQAQRKAQIKEAGKPLFRQALPHIQAGNLQGAMAIANSSPHAEVRFLVYKKVITTLFEMNQPAAAQQFANATPADMQSKVWLHIGKSLPAEQGWQLAAGPAPFAENDRFKLVLHVIKTVLPTNPAVAQQLFTQAPAHYQARLQQELQPRQ